MVFFSTARDTSKLAWFLFGKKTWEGMGSCFCVHFLNDLEGKKSKSDQSWIKSLNEQSNLLVWVWFYIKESLMPLICRLVAIVPWGNVVFLCYLFFLYCHFVPVVKSCVLRCLLCQSLFFHVPPFFICFCWWWRRA